MRVLKILRRSSALLARRSDAVPLLEARHQDLDLLLNSALALKSWNNIQRVEWIERLVEKYVPFYVLGVCEFSMPLESVSVCIRTAFLFLHVNICTILTERSLLLGTEDCWMFPAIRLLCFSDRMALYGGLTANMLIYRTFLRGTDALEK